MLKVIKLLLIIISVYSLFFHISTLILESDNQIPLYEDNKDYSMFETNIRPIAIFFPSFNLNIKKNKTIYIEYNQKRTQDYKNNYSKINNMDIIKKQIQLAKSHGIYGFAINYNVNNDKKNTEDELDIFFNNNEINFPSFLILENFNYKNIVENIIDQELKEEYFEKIIKNIKSYLMSPNYIRINEKHVLGIYISCEVSILNNLISLFKKYSIKYGIKQLIIFGFLNAFTCNTKIEDYQKLASFKLVIMLPPKNYINEDKIKEQNYSFYNYLLYKNIELNNHTANHYYYRCSILEYKDFSNINQSLVYNDYSPEIFYIFNKIIVDYTKKNFNNTNQFIFINSWNHLNKGSYLEPDEKFGYASLNSLSKSIFNLPYKNISTFTIINEKSIIAVQAHIFYEELIDEIIEKTNNIPVKFDLFISTNSKFKKEFIEKKIQNKTNAINYEIKIFKNKGRDVLPFIIQLKKVIKNYKYICHIHTKKSLHSKIGEEWRSYLFTNLLGNNQIVSEILSDFEMSENLGIIFPEIFHQILSDHGNMVNKYNLIYMNYLIRKINPYYKIIETVSDFPAGNMFWARTNAVYQIFGKNVEKRFPEEKGQIDSTIIHAIERIWIYLVKVNGYYYKKIFKHF